MQQMIEAIVKEIHLRKDYIDATIDSIYFGGGTPSMLSLDQLETILNSVFQNFVIVEDVEITLEANPDDVTTEKLASWKRIGINRFSLGVQSFYEEDLQWMHRAHNAQQAVDSIELIRNAGFDNFTIDLIYGTPTLTDEHWEKNVSKAISLQIPHLSCYALTVEPDTALYKLIEKKKLQNVDVEKQARHFEQLIGWMKNADYDHYEVSNFGKPNFHSRHNSSYWKGQSYIGFGPSAHSFNIVSRQWNVANNIQYIHSLEKNIIPFEIEYLTPHQQLEEYIMTSLRTMEGLSLNYVRNKWNEKEAERILNESESFIKAGNMRYHSDSLILTEQGFLFADGIAAALF